MLVFALSILKPQNAVGTFVSFSFIPVVFMFIPPPPPFFKILKHFIEGLLYLCWSQLMDSVCNQVAVTV